MITPELLQQWKQIAIDAFPLPNNIFNWTFENIVWDETSNSKDEDHEIGCAFTTKEFIETISPQNFLALIEKLERYEEDLKTITTSLHIGYTVHDCVNVAKEALEKE